MPQIQIQFDLEKCSDQTELWFCLFWNVHFSDLFNLQELETPINKTEEEGLLVVR